MNDPITKRIQILLVLSIFLAGVFSTSFAKLTPEQAQELNKIEAAIKAKGAKWKAGENAIAKLPKELKKKLCGLRIESSPSKEDDGAALEALSLPATFDWRTDQKNVVTPIKNQGSCGSCWAFAAVGAMESKLLIEGNADGADLSEQFVVSCDLSNFACDGGYMSYVYNFLTTTGTTDENCFPYSSGIEGIVPGCEEKCSDWEDRLSTISGWTAVASPLHPRRGVANIKAAVMNGPVSVGMDVYDDFFSYTGGVYEHVTGALAGGHAIIIVGWEDANECWIVKNSWGNWGEGGYFRIKWRDCNIGTSAAEFHYHYEQPCDDADGDGYEDIACGGDDCNDADATINPGAPEICGDGIDNNCDGIKGNFYYQDSDGDGFGNKDVSVDDQCTAPDYYVGNNTDCNDNDASINPGVEETCDDLIDNNCNGEVDEGCSSCEAAGAPCDSDSDCCSDKCIGKPGSRTCK